MIKVIAILVILGLSIWGVYHYTQSNKPQAENNLYQGPVPKGYDLTHYRQTGETIKEVKPNG